jgi:hypothetical protein
MRSLLLTATVFSVAASPPPNIVFAVIDDLVGDALFSV